MATEKQTKYLVDENETIYTTYEQEIQGDGIEKDLSLKLIVTNKNIYSNSIYDYEEQENIIDLKSVEFVNYTHTKVKQNHNGLLTFGFLLLIGGLIMGCMLIPQADNNAAFLIIIGFVIANNIEPEEIKKLQKDIFKAKSNL